MNAGLPWHHVHITIEDREAAARWHENNGPATRVTPTKRSENLMYGPNLMQIQSEAVALEPKGASIHSLGLTVTDIERTMGKWLDSGADVIDRGDSRVLLGDPWATPFELIEGDYDGFTHINIATADPAGLRSWYQANLGGTPQSCRWREDSPALCFDSLALIFDEDRGPAGSDRILDHLGWYTANLDETYERLTHNHVKFTVPPRQFGAVRLAFAQDPYGIWFELVEPPGGKINKTI